MKSRKDGAAELGRESTEPPRCIKWVDPRSSRTKPKRKKKRHFSGKPSSRVGVMVEVSAQPLVTRVASGRVQWSDESS